MISDTVITYYYYKIFDSIDKFGHNYVSPIVRHIKYRTTYQYHVIRTGLRPGKIPTEDRILYGMFSILVDFVELDIANSYLRSRQPIYISEQSNIKYFLKRLKFKIINQCNGFFKNRNPKLGIEYIRDELSDVPNSGFYISDLRQNVFREIWDLYHWWKFIRPMRLDPSDASGWTKWCTVLRESESNLNLSTAEIKMKEQKILSRYSDIEHYYNNEDKKQLIRLINIRDKLWT